MVCCPQKIILDQIKRIIHKDIDILAIGCGTGIMFEYLKEFGTIQGLDFSGEAVHYSILRLRDKVPIKLENLSDRLPFENKGFDIYDRWMSPQT